MSLAPLPRSREDDYAPEAAHARLALAADSAGRSLEHLAGKPVRTQAARGNIENLVGYAQVPVGLAGPLDLDTSAGKRSVYVPMATTEGAMVASYSRGMKLLSMAGTARARVLEEGLSQHPILVYGSVVEAERAAEIVIAERATFEALTARGTSHGRLVTTRPEVVGRRLILTLRFTTGDAIGINMAAKAAEACAAHLADLTSPLERYVHGEDVEKRANARALIEGRGRNTVAEVEIERDLLQKVLRVSPEDLVAIQATYALGFARLGTQNHLIQAANGLAAVLLAVGLDVAYVTECATGHLDFALSPSGSLLATAHLPSLLVGTVGAGTGYGTAAECLDILGVRGDGGANVLAEIMAATVLAGDLSLMASFCTHEFVAAHESLGRNRPQDQAGA